MGWIGFDLDGTLAKTMNWKSLDDIGEPIAPMVALAKKYIAEGREVRIVTARAMRKREGIEPVMRWCLRRAIKSRAI